MSNRLNKLLEQKKLAKEVTGWEIPPLKDSGVDKKLTAVIDKLRKKNKRKLSVVLEIFRFKIGEYVPFDFLTPTYGDTPDPVSGVRLGIKRLNIDNLLLSEDLKIVEIPAIQVSRSVGGVAYNKVKLEVKEVELVLDQAINDLKKSSNVVQLNKVLKLIKELKNEPFTTSELAKEFAGPNSEKEALRILNSLEKAAKDINFKNTFYVLLNKAS